MEGKDYKLFIVEGEKRELEIIDNLCGVFFKHANFKVISLPAGQNIYMLWKKMKQDDFETDIIEVLRENDNSVNDLLEGIPRNYFSEVYLFFDYDVHQKNLTSDERVLMLLQKCWRHLIMKQKWGNFISVIRWWKHFGTMRGIDAEM